MADSKRHPAALPLARLCGEIHRAAARSRRRTMASFQKMLEELESNAEQLDGFALALEMICEHFGLTCEPAEEDEGSLDSGERSETEQRDAGGAPVSGDAVRT